MDRGAWQARVHGVSKSWTQLKQLNMHDDDLDQVSSVNDEDLSNFGPSINV